MFSTRKLTLTAMFTAVGTITSHLVFIPVGFAKIFPVQHFLNVLSAVMLGPFYAVLQASSVSLLRNLMGTGSLFAFPGSMIGAFLAAIVYQKVKKPGAAAIGEVVGTGIFGAMMSFPLSALILGQDVALFGFVPSFLVSSFTGGILGYCLLKVLINHNAFVTITGRLEK
ncbi:energy coupling factor transporter S component ThiW [Bacillus aquiflavi]|uniref:Energy coupling factor transporter S component ThiW n=1 Tax=Bacillus aquiflavi TaxID=2672567 RepID=A0A6B3VVW4_9BACI|nr:energy coupling factor transporter S component ThiW [Bacillus aquiflavi]MBA4536775.1 energy coupling factor transporter S component ThiW [Bacillus aquiflavi]NEY81142.1 energy coupling factor transporter S component ThiW [Bacillus aquiflavi]UAC50016.1 energy coupling factor transporter S component ThiW [Bacillus aquiflavi]